MRPLVRTAATSFWPSAEEATDCHSLLDSLAVQVSPKSLEVQMWLPSVTATSLLPSAEEATAAQFVTNACGVQFASPRFSQIMDWPACARTVHPPLPTPVMRIVLATAGAIGSKMVVFAVFVTK